MNLQLQKTAVQAILYDADSMPPPPAEWFDPEYWREEKAIVRAAPGRGSTLLLDTPVGPAALRTALRGGWAANVSRDRYLFTGFESSRPLAEVRLLAHMLDQGLPVPRPLAGLCRRRGLTYSGALLTSRILSATPLADELPGLAPGDLAWTEAGRCISRFHAAGVIHPDLNARNVLLRKHGDGAVDFYLVDFDRATVREGAKRAFRANLNRLHRSLTKHWPEDRADSLEACWHQLLKGYNSAG